MSLAGTGLDQPMILHGCPRATWESALAAGAYTADTLDTEGFVHCSDFGTVHLPLTALFRGRTDLVLLVIDPARVAAPVRWEPGDPADPAGTPWFPHVYGPIPAGAVVAAHAMVPEPDGSFLLPAALRGT
jgi:uncharacterized protein (DUF952 family)